MKIKVKCISEYTEKDWKELRESVVNMHYSKMFERRIAPNAYEDYEEKETADMGMKETKKFIGNLISTGFKVVTGYRCSTAGIRNFHTSVILYKKNLPK